MRCEGRVGQTRNHAKTCERHMQEELPQLDFVPRCDPQTRACTFLLHLGDENTGRANGGGEYRPCYEHLLAWSG